MKKLIFLSIIALALALVPINSNATIAQSACGQNGDWVSGPSVTSSNCGQINLFIVTIVTGSITTTTTYTNLLTGDTCETTTTEDCSSGNRWQWIWE